MYHLNDEYDIIFENNDNIYRNCDITLSNVDILWYNNNGFPFTIRTRIDGDKILLSKGHKKIKDLMIDLKLSKKEKDKALVLLDKDDNILSLLGYKKSSILSKGKDNNLLIRLVRR